MNSLKYSLNIICLFYCLHAKLCENYLSSLALIVETVQNTSAIGSKRPLKSPTSDAQGKAKKGRSLPPKFPQHPINSKLTTLPTIQTLNRTYPKTLIYRPKLKFLQSSSPGQTGRKPRTTLCSPGFSPSVVVAKTLNTNKIICIDIEAFHIVTKISHQLKHRHPFIRAPRNRTLKVVIKGFLNLITEFKVADELKILGYDVLHVRQFGKTKINFLSTRPSSEHPSEQNYLQYFQTFWHIR